MASTHRKAFVFTGMSFLLVIPAIILAASFSGMVRYGEAGREIALQSDVIYYITKDVRETIEEAAKKSGRWEAHSAVKLVMDTYVNLTRTANLSHAKTRSFFPNTEVDPQGRNATTYLQDKIIDTLNDRVDDTIAELERRSGKDIIFNNGNDITNEVIINQSDPWGFYLLVSEMPLNISGGGSAINTTISAFNVYITFEGLEDPYIFVQSEANAFSRVYRSPYWFYNESYDENVSIMPGGTIEFKNLDDVLIGSGTEDNPIPYYHYFDNTTRDDGISFFSRLEGNTTNRPYKIETFLIGDVLRNQSDASRVDHAYFNNALGSPITICGAEVKDPLNNVFYIDDVHLGYYDLNRSYFCNSSELKILQNDISFNSTMTKVGEEVIISVTVHNDGGIDASNVKVQFFNGDPDSGGTEIGSNQTIATIVAEGNGTASITWTATGGTNNIYVRVDPDDTISEVFENNNQAFNVICVNTALSVSIQTPIEGFTTDNCNTTTVAITATIQDTCSNIVPGTNASVAAYINTSGTVTLTDPDVDGTYSGNWGPSVNASTSITVNASGSTGSSWESLIGLDIHNGTVGSCQTIAMEAEDGTLNAPMVNVSDASVCGGWYVRTPEGVCDDTGPAAGHTCGYDNFTVTIPADDTYTFWGRVYGDSSSSDSFWISVDWGTESRWDLPVGSWNWRVASDDETLTDPNDPQAYNWTLSAGNHTFTVRTREDDSRLDRIVITRDYSLTPSGCS